MHRKAAVMLGILLCMSLLSSICYAFDADRIVLENSMTGRLSDPSQTTTVACPTADDLLAVLDIHHEGNHHVTIETSAFVLTIEETSGVKRSSAPSSTSRRGKRGVVLLSDVKTDDPIASFEYSVDRDEAVAGGGGVTSTVGTASVFGAASPPGRAQAKHVTPSGVVMFSITQEALREIVSYEMHFHMDEGQEIGGFQKDFVIVVTSTDATRTAKRESAALAASTAWDRWASPLVLFGCVYGLLYAAHWWCSSVRGVVVANSSAAKPKKE